MIVDYFRPRRVVFLKPAPSSKIGCSGARDDFVPTLGIKAQFVSRVRRVEVEAR
jgi:hypothetical protein